MTTKKQDLSHPNAPRTFRHLLHHTLRRRLRPVDLERAGGAVPVGGRRIAARLRGAGAGIGDDRLVQFDGASGQATARVAGVFAMAYVVVVPRRRDGAGDVRAGTAVRDAAAAWPAGFTRSRRAGDAEHAGNR